MKALAPFKILCLVTVLAAPFGAASQNLKNEAAMTHIHHIEEFIERFNYLESTTFHKFVQNNYPESNIDRRVVLRSLFQDQNPVAGHGILTDFINSVDGKKDPVYLDIYDALWYAKIPLLLEVDKNEYSAFITLEIQLNDDYSIEWTIIGFQSELLADRPDDQNIFIAASSHATFFPELKRVLSSSTKFEAVMSNKKDQSSVNQFRNYIAENKITQVHILKGITYHFLQISGWIMEVGYVESDIENTLNSGWLIRKVIPIEYPRDKLIYRKDVLGIN
jgi:hypothetical protein